MPPHPRPRVLVTLPDVAWPLNGGKRLRCAGALEGLAQVADVDLAVLFSTAPESGAPFGPGTQVARWVRLPARRRPAPAAVLRSVSARVPWLVGAQDWDAARSALEEWTGPAVYDLAWFGALDHAFELSSAVPAALQVVDVDDVETDKWRSYLQNRPRDLAHWLEWLQRRVELPLWARVQDRVFSRADAAVVCTAADAAQVLAMGARTAAVLPNTYPDPGPVPRDPDADRPVVLFVGNFAVAANVDAAVHLVRDVFPAVRAAVPGARLRLVGREAVAVQHLSGPPGVEVVGEVADVRPELTAASVSVVPVRFGGGTRLKVLEAFASRVPVVGTSLGVEGFGAVDDVHLLVAETPATIAAAVVRVLQDAGLRRRLVAAAHELYEERFTPRAASAAVADLVQDVLQRRS